MLAKDRADSSSIIPDFSAHLDGNESCFLFLPAWIKHIHILISAPFYFFIFILSTHILGLLVNLESLSVIHLLSNFSSASWNLQITSSSKKLVFPSSEYRSRFSLHVTTPHLRFCHCCCHSLPFPIPGMSIGCPCLGQSSYKRSRWEFYNISD